MSEEKEKEVLGEIKIGSCTYVASRSKSEPGVVRLEGVSCDIRADLEKANNIIGVLFGGAEIRFKPHRFVKEEERPVKA
ncbi:MAG: hypothetical protein ACLQEQ_07345 [Nitrososphaerales archaeon]